MIRLAIDCATTTTVMGLFDESVCLGDRRMENARGDRLPGLLKEILEETGILAPEIQEVCCGVGPGSFTGVRICLSFAHGFAHRRNLPVRGASSLASCLAAHLPRTPCIAVLDAQRDEAFVRFQPGISPDQAKDTVDERWPLERLFHLPPHCQIFAEGRAPFLSRLPQGWLPLSPLVNSRGVLSTAMVQSIPALPNYLRESAPEELRKASGLL